jgi:hypothetical protein
MGTRPRDFLESVTRTRVGLIRDLAEGKLTQRKLAEKYDATQEGIRDFLKRHKAEVERLRENLEDHLFGLWIADKAARLAEYQDDVELTNAELEAALEGRLGVSTTDSEGNVTWERVEDLSDVIGRLLRGKHRALRSVAEERGHLPARVVLSTGDGARVHHIIENVDHEKL